MIQDVDIEITDGTSSSDEEHPDHFKGIISNQIQSKSFENFDGKNLTNKRKGFFIQWTDNTDQRHYGNCRPFFYYKGEPLCILGPDCKTKKNLNSRVFFYLNDNFHPLFLVDWTQHAHHSRVSHSLCHYGSYH